MVHGVADVGQAVRIVLYWLDGFAVDLRQSCPPREVLKHAPSAAGKYGLGKRALSNFNCFHFAYAKAAGLPVLTLDHLLGDTDLQTVADGR